MTASHDVSRFSCGKEALDRWLKTRALSNQQKGFTVVMVVHDGGCVAGYYGLAPAAVMPAVMPRAIRSGQPPNPVPCLLLGQLATDLGWAGRGIGSGLVRHALERCVAGAALVGGRAVMVNAIDEGAASFWRGNGFIPAPENPRMLFRSMSDIRASVAAAHQRRNPLPNAPARG